MSNNNIIGIIGGTGIYDLSGLDRLEILSCPTPFGEPSSKITSGYLGETKLLFIARHGLGHTLLPSELNTHANIYALKEKGANCCLSISAVGSLCEEYKPGDVVIPDQLIDRTQQRKNTFFGEGIVAHVSFADPYCPEFSSLLHQVSLSLSAKENKAVHWGGTYLCMEGPAFSTRAESELYRSWGAKLIGMTALPEAKLAREAEMSYATLALVTDYDCWRTSSSDVEIAEILKIMGSNVNFAKKIISGLAIKIKDIEQRKSISSALENAIVTPRELWPQEKVFQLKAILKKYLN